MKGAPMTTTARPSRPDPRRRHLTRTVAVAGTLVVAAAFGAAHAAGASPSPAPPAAPEARVQPVPPPRFLPIIGPTGKPVVDEHGTQLIMDTAPATGQPNPNGVTVIDTIPPASAVAAASTDARRPSTPTPSIVRPYDDTKYHEK